MADFARPALLGGTPVRSGGPPAWPLPDPDVSAALSTAVAAGAWGQYHGDHVCALEAELAAFHQVAHALTCSSGTLAVEVALRALRVGPGDEVVVAAYEYESTFLTVHAIGAKPVLIDVYPHNWQLDDTKLEAAFTPRTKAVICSHLHGGIVNVPAVVALARKHGVGVVEDAAQAPGATVAGKPAGTWGDVGTLSFGGSKLLTAGRGGALLFTDSQLHQRAKTWLHRGLQQWAPLSELQAAALRPQLRKLTETTRSRGERVKELVELLRGGASPEGEFGFSLSPLPAQRGPTPPSPLPEGRGGHAYATSPEKGTDPEGREELRSPVTSGTSEEVPRACSPLPSGRGVGSPVPFALTVPDSAPAYYKLGFRFDPAAFGVSREVFVKALRAEGIAFDAGFKSLHVGRSPSRFRAAGELAHATDAHERCVMLHHPVLSGATADVQQVAEAIAKVYRYRDRF